MSWMDAFEQQEWFQLPAYWHQCKKDRALKDKDDEFSIQKNSAATNVSTGRKYQILIQ